MRFGENLRSERERRGIALDDIAVATRVSMRHLSALEAEQFRDLPGGVFNRGIVRSYARHVGLDEDSAVSAYGDALRQQGMDPTGQNEDWTAFAENVKRNRTIASPGQRIRWAGVLVMVFGVLVSAIGVLALLVHRNMVVLPSRVQAALHGHLRQHPHAPPPAE